MYLHRIYAKNFRIFGDGTIAPKLDWKLNKGLNILIGENDAGKSGIIDAIRKVLWTTSFEAVRIVEQDFHIAGANRADILEIEATLRGLSPEQEASVLEWLTYESDGSLSLTLHLQARRNLSDIRRRNRIDVIVRSGKNGGGPEIGYAVRELVRATYLRPLRDAEAELSSGRQSRLSQILGAHASLAEQRQSDFDAKKDDEPKTLVGLMEQAQYKIGKHPAVSAVKDNINDNYLSKMSFTGDRLSSDIRITGGTTLSQILEKFELSLLPPESIASSERCNRGLGYNNALFMATELVLLKSEEELALLLVEEPEAHLHPQLQLRIMELLQQKPNENERDIQIVLSTHSPTLAATASIDSMTIVHKGKTYPLRSTETMLAQGDYAYLQRFIDATKSNLFFARGVAIVEGPAEALLIPAIAQMAELSFSTYGVSIVNVGDVGLFHYARIFQRKDGKDAIPVPVACITDRDIVPDNATYVTTSAKKRFESDYSVKESTEHIQRKVDRVEQPGNSSVKVFVSDFWTLEYDLARAGLAELMFKAIYLAKKADSLTVEKEQELLTKADAEWTTIKEKNLSSTELASFIYQPLYENKASKAVTAQYAANLLYSGKFGTGQTLLNALPTYLKRALRHLTGTSDPMPVDFSMEDLTPAIEKEAVTNLSSKMAEEKAL